MVFICFSGEEEGLYGSEYYNEHPLFPINNHIYMVDMDMIGYYYNATTIHAFGGNSSNEINNIIGTLDNDYPFTVDTSHGSYFYQSDHYPFS